MEVLYQQKDRLKLFRRWSNLDFVPHLHNALELVLFTQGSATVICDTKRYALSAGDIFIAFPNQVHGYENSCGRETMVFIIPTVPYLAPFQSTLEKMLPAEPLLRAGQWEHTGVDRILKMALADANCPDAVMQGYALLVVGKLLPLLCLKPYAESSASALHSLLQYLNTHYTQPLTRKELAAATGYNESYISHLFSDILHTTLTNYLATLRMDDARYLLANSDMTVSSIALSLGFGSIRSFNRVFLSRMNMSPAAYRATHKKQA